jgi:hypothetical protein
MMNLKVKKRVKIFKEFPDMYIMNTHIRIWLAPEVEKAFTFCDFEEKNYLFELISDVILWQFRLGKLKVI